MPAKVEKRADPTEKGGKKFSLAQFKQFYGAKRGASMWDKAGKKGGGGKGGGAVEKRRDPTDPRSKKTYTKAAFQKFYGERDGAKMWKKAGQKYGAAAPASPKGKKGAKGGEERRKDPTVPQGKKTYTLQQFKDFYGAKIGAAMWKKAGSGGKASAPAKAAKPAAPRVDKELLAEALKAATSKPAKTVTLIAPLPSGMPEGKHFKIVEKEVSAEIQDGEALLETLAMSADPYLRGQIKTMPAGSPMVGFVCVRVLASKIKGPKFRPGNILGTNLPFSTVQVVKKDMFGPGKAPCWNLTGLVSAENAGQGIGVLGMPGATAHGGVLKVLRPKKARKPKKGEEKHGEVLFVSAASGAVGQLVGQIAKTQFGCTIIGSAGGPEKCAALTDKFGFDAAIDYKTCKTAEDLQKKLMEATKCEAKDGKCIDMYFENVGGIHFDAALASLKPGGRIAVCGCISQYNEADQKSNSLPLWSMIYPQLRIEGFVCFPWLKDGPGSFVEDNGKWLKQGKLKITETVSDGIDSWPNAFQSLFTGKNYGKVVVRIVEQPLPLTKPKAPRTAKE